MSSHSFSLVILPRRRSLYYCFVLSPENGTPGILSLCSIFQCCRGILCVNFFFFVLLCCSFSSCCVVARRPNAFSPSRISATHRQRTPRTPIAFLASSSNVEDRRGSRTLESHRGVRSASACRPVRVPSVDERRHASVRSARRT